MYLSLSLSLSLALVHMAMQFAHTYTFVVPIHHYRSLPSYDTSASENLCEEESIHLLILCPKIMYYFCEKKVHTTDVDLLVVGLHVENSCFCIMMYLEANGQISASLISIINYSLIITFI